MKSNKFFQAINFLIMLLLFFLTFFIGFEIVKLKNNIISYVILGLIGACLAQLYIKIFIKQNNS